MYLMLKKIYGEVVNNNGEAITVELITVSEAAKELRVKHEQQVSSIYQRMYADGKTRLNYTKIEGSGLNGRVMICRDEKYEALLKSRLTFLQNKKEKKVMLKKRSDIGSRVAVKRM